MMNTTVLGRVRTSTWWFAMIAASACGEPQDPVPLEHATESDGNLGDGSDGSTGAPEFQGCLIFGDDEEFGYVHQCEAEVKVRFQAKVLGTLETFDWDDYFGNPYLPAPLVPPPDDSHENPKVMACCSPIPELDPIDPDYYEDFTSQHHYKACFHDLLEQGCRSLVFRLREEVGGLQAKALADWIAEHQQECRDAFWPTVEAWEWSPAEEELDLTGVWNVPDSAAWPSIKDISIELSDVSGQNKVFSAHLPEEESDWTQCSNQMANNDNVWVPANDPIDDFTLVGGSADLRGPAFPPDPEFVTGTASFESIDTQCDLCSTLSHTLAPNLRDRVIDFLLLDTDEVEVGTSTQSLTLDRVRILLYEPEDARLVAHGEWEVASGEATFIVSAFGDGAAGVVSTTNASAIRLKYSPILGWRILPFLLSYTDANSETWGLSIGTLTWED